MEFSCVTRFEGSPAGKPRVFFTSHPDDLPAYFEEICQGILAVNDCAIHYTEDASTDLSSETAEVVLERMALFVIPVTYRLLTEPNRALDHDLPFALEHHIPVLPLMMEPGLDALYATPDRFGELQYLTPHTRDASEVSYQEKLKSFLDSVLVSDATAQRVRDAFDAYIFLSYRKKDRVQANEFMRLVHENSELRSTAIWFDEFLTPGESFADNIDQALEKCDLFTLLVTPNVLEMTNGEPNFVMGVEYPSARSASKEILPAVMTSVDEGSLQDAFDGLPECVDAHDDEALRKRLLEAFPTLDEDQGESPERDFLMGLAYLDGIDVERHKERGLELIARAANAGHAEAMQKLSDMYTVGAGVSRDLEEALHWALMLAEHREKVLGDEDPATLASLNNVAYLYDELGRLDQALELYERAYEGQRRAQGDEDPSTLLCLSNLAQAVGRAGDHPRALALHEQVHRARRDLLGEEDEATLISLGYVASEASEGDDLERAVALYEDAYDLSCRIYGKLHPHTLGLLNGLGYAVLKAGRPEQAFELQHRAYEGLLETLGDQDPWTIGALDNAACALDAAGDPVRARAFHEQALRMSEEALGPEHPTTLEVLSDLAATQGKLGDHLAAMKLNARVFTTRRKLLGMDDEQTISALYDSVPPLIELGDTATALTLLNLAYDQRRSSYGDADPRTLNALNWKAYGHVAYGEFAKALECYEQAYETGCAALGEDHPAVQAALINAVTLRDSLQG